MEVTLFIIRSIILSLLLISTVQAQEVQVFQFASNTAIVLGPVPCKKGHKAVVQRLDGNHVKGCWYEDPANKENYRIDWENPQFPNDFSVIPKANFHVEDL